MEQLRIRLEQTTDQLDDSEEERKKLGIKIRDLESDLDKARRQGQEKECEDEDPER